jgi:hypothetical protein
MENSRDSSLWRSLAVAFGDGLAFGVGMKLTQTGTGKSGAAPESPPADRVSRIEQRLARLERAPASGSLALDQGVLDALVAALEARLQESGAKVDRRLAELEIKLAADLTALRQQDQSLASGSETRLEELGLQVNEQVQALRQKVNDDRNTLQGQVIALHREFAAAVADIVEEQVANQVEQRVEEAVQTRMAALEEHLREEIRQTSESQRLEMSDLRQRLTENDRNVLDVLLTMGEVFRQAAGRLGAPPVPAPLEAPQPPAETPAPAAEVSSEPPAEDLPKSQEAAAEPQRIPPGSATSAEAVAGYTDLDLPGFAQPRKASAVFSIPLVSSFLVTALCVALLQYL